MKLYIFRHGQTEANIQGICQGLSGNWPLNNTGINQAEELGKELAMLKLPVIYASPQLRAQMTAQAVAKHNHTPIETIYDLHETMFGEGEGMYEADMLRKYDSVFKSQLNPSAPDFLTAKIPGGESIQDNYDRFDRVIEYIKNNCPHDKAGVATHGTFMAMVFYRLYGVFHEFRNCEYFVIEI
ncbi:MAG: histidine phosphatase family protein [Alphaproteobacteria bacterium]